MAEREMRVTEAAKAKPRVIAGKINWLRLASGSTNSGVKVPIAGRSPK